MVGAAGEHVVLKEDRSYVVSEPNGAIRSDSPDGQGLWIGDTRILSHYRLRNDGEEPVVQANSLDAETMRLEATAAGLKVERELFVEVGLQERITITNAGPAAAEADLELTLGADFVDMLALRGVAPDHASRPYASIEEAQSGVLLKEGNGSGGAIEVVITPPGTNHRIALRVEEAIQQGLLVSR